MKKNKAPPGGYVWERPGFRFFTPPSETDLGFPPGYVPHLADDACRISINSRNAIAEAAARGTAAQRAHEASKVKL